MIRGLCVVGALALLAAGCGDEISGVAINRIAALSIDGSPCANIETGSSCVIPVTAINPAGETIPSPDLVWFSTTQSVATVTGSSDRGTVMGVGEGTTTIVVADRTRTITEETNVQVFPAGPEPPGNGPAQNRGR